MSTWYIRTPACSCLPRDNPSDQTRSRAHVKRQKRNSATLSCALSVMKHGIIACLHRCLYGRLLPPIMPRYHHHQHAEGCILGPTSSRASGCQLFPIPSEAHLCHLYCVLTSPSSSTSLICSWLSRAWTEPSGKDTLRKGSSALTWPRYTCCACHLREALDEVVSVANSTSLLLGIRLGAVQSDQSQLFSCHECRGGCASLCELLRGCVGVDANL